MARGMGIMGKIDGTEKSVIVSVCVYRGRWIEGTFVDDDVDIPSSSW